MIENNGFNEWLKLFKRISNMLKSAADNLLANFRSLDWKTNNILKPTIGDDLVKKYKCFAEKFPGSYDLIYYPCCGYDVSPSVAFENSRVVYCDMNINAVNTLSQNWYEIYMDDAKTFDTNSLSCLETSLVIILNPQVPSQLLINNLKIGWYVLCNDYHRTATQLRNNTSYEFVGIIRQIGKWEFIVDTDNLDDCWKEVETDEELKLATSFWVSYENIKQIVKKITGEDTGSIIDQYKKIIENLPEDQKKLAKHIGIAEIRIDWEKKPLTIYTMLPKKKWVVDDTFIFRKIR